MERRLVLEGASCASNSFVCRPRRAAAQRRPQHLLQHLIAWPKGLLSPLVQNQDLIHCSKRTGAMSNHDGNAAAGTDAEILPLSGPLRPRSPDWNWARPEPRGRDRDRAHGQAQLSGVGPPIEPHLPLRCECRSPLEASPRAHERRRIWPRQ